MAGLRYPSHGRSGQTGYPIRPSAEGRSNWLNHIRNDASGMKEKRKRLSNVSTPQEYATPQNQKPKRGENQRCSTEEAPQGSKHQRKHQGSLHCKGWKKSSANFKRIVELPGDVFR